MVLRIRRLLCNSRKFTHVRLFNVGALSAVVGILSVNREKRIDSGINNLVDNVC